MIKDTPEVKALRQKAKDLGLKVHSRTGEVKLRKAIADYEAMQDGVQNSSPEPQETPEEKTATVVSDGYQPKPGEKLYYTEEEFMSKEMREARRIAGRLIRIRTTCMNPNKKNWTGEILSVGSAKMGTFKKFVPFNSEEPYHVPYAIYQFMKERKCRIGTTVKMPNGQEVNRYKLVNEFSIEVLPPLTETELEELKQRQAMASGAAMNL
jgi:hypothetical protein